MVSVSPELLYGEKFEDTSKIQISQYKRENETVFLQYDL